MWKTSSNNFNLDHLDIAHILKVMIFQIIRKQTFNQAILIKKLVECLLWNVF